MGLFDRIKEGLRKTRESISGSIESMLHSFTKIDEELFEELEELLVMGDVGIYTAERICDELRVRVKKQGVTDPNAVMGLLKDIVADMLSGGEELQIARRPAAILVIGVNGVGKTTTIGKLASRLKGEGLSVVLGAADTFRAAAIDQLEIWAERADVPIVTRPEGSDPASVVFDTIAKAKSLHADVLICDTAGRLHNKKNLMDELAKISRILDRELPDSDKEVLLVLDATTGQNAVNQAREFKNAAGITGIVLTKLDGTAKGGVVLAIREELQLPVKFIGVGEKLEDLQPFDATAFAEALFDNDRKIDEDTMAKIAEQNARYDAYGELIEDADSQWETGTEAGDAALEAQAFMEELKTAVTEAMDDARTTDDDLPAYESTPLVGAMAEEEGLTAKEEAQLEAFEAEQAKQREIEKAQKEETKREKRLEKVTEKVEPQQVAEEPTEEFPTYASTPLVGAMEEEEGLSAEEEAALEEYEAEQKETWAERRARKQREKEEKRLAKEAEAEQESVAEEPSEEETLPVYEPTPLVGAMEEEEGLTAEEEAALEEFEAEQETEHKETREERKARKLREKEEKRAQKEERKKRRWF